MLEASATHGRRYVQLVKTASFLAFEVRWSQAMDALRPVLVHSKNAHFPQEKEN
jgi:hypothetical protein